MAYRVNKNNGFMVVIKKKKKRNTDVKEIWENSWREMPQQVKGFNDKCCIKTGLYRNFETDLQVTEMKVCGGATDAAECVDIFVETW